MPATCAHCGAPLESPDARYCCVGCETVASLLTEGGLTRYYALGGKSGGPVPAPTQRDHLWLAAIAQSLASSGHASLDVQGLRCSACTWLFEETFRRRPGAKRIEVNPGLGRLALWTSRDFDLLGYVSELEQLGYVLGPADKVRDHQSDALLLRAGITSAIAMNVMTFSIAEYLGMTEEPLRGILRAATVALTALAVSMAAPTFVRGAWSSLRKGVLSLDVPIALGIVLASAACGISYLVHGEPRYADTVAVFMALMLIGRTVERRSLAHARRQLLADADLPALFVRRVRSGVVDVVRAKEITAGDELLVAPGEVVPVDATLIGAPAELSLEWISGESQPQSRMPSEQIPAGAFVRGDRAANMLATGAFDASPLLALVRRPPPQDEAHGPAFWDRVARGWAFLVLIAAGLTMTYWLLRGDWEGALLATTAVLVVSCPCGIGIANPLAHELARATLRKAGVFIRSARALDRAAEVSAVVFDKTGTLTTGALELSAEENLGADEKDLEIAAAMASQSTHPRAVALRLAYRGVHRAPADVKVREVLGQGLEAEHGRFHYRLGRPAFAAPGHQAPEGELVFSREGQALVQYRFDEVLHQDAAQVVRGLKRAGEHGEAKPIYVLSGDAAARVRVLGAAIGVAPEHCIGDARPEDKATWLRTIAPQRALFVGDGLNDALAAEAAFLSGTPSIDRPFLPARTDFHFLSVGKSGGGLSSLRKLLEVGRRLRRVTRRNLAFALVYNLVVVVWAASGQLHPWLAAVLMPLSSLVVISNALLSFTVGPTERDQEAELCPIAPPTLSLSAQEPSWKSSF